MKNPVLVTFLFVALIVEPAAGQSPERCAHNNSNDKKIEDEFKRLHAYEAELIIRGDAVGLDDFYPEDHIVTNPFNQLIGKKVVLERIRGNVIKYTSYNKRMEYLCVYENTAIIAGIEVGTAAKDAKRPDAGLTSSRRFTETWMKRGEHWRKVARHVSTMTPPQLDKRPD